MMEPMEWVAITAAVVAAIKAIKSGSSEVIDLIWESFFANLDIPKNKSNAVRGWLFSRDPVYSASVLLHIWEDYNRGPDRGNATAWQINAATDACGLTPYQSSQVRMMWYFMWGNADAAHGTSYYQWQLEQEIGGAVAGLPQSQVDSVVQYYALNGDGRAQYLQKSPPATWTTAFRDAMIAAAHAIGDTSPVNESSPTVATGGADGSTGMLAVGGLAALWLFWPKGKKDA